MTAEELTEYVADEQPALVQLRKFVGGEAGPRLDGSAYGLALLDTYLANLTADPDWTNSSFFEGFADVRKWLAVRVAYYIGVYARQAYGCQWYLCEDAESPVHATPVMAVHGVEFSPLEVALAHVNREVDGGLVQFFADLDVHVLTIKGHHH